MAIQAGSVLILLDSQTPEVLMDGEGRFANWPQSMIW